MHAYRKYWQDHGAFTGLGLAGEGAAQDGVGRWEGRFREQQTGGAAPRSHRCMAWAARAEAPSVEAPSA